MPRFLKLILLVLLVLLGLFLGRYLLTHYDLAPQAIRNYLLSFGPWAPLVYIIVYMIRPLVFFPASILSIAGGLVFGPLFGTIYTVIGASLGALLSFGIARFLGRDFVKPLFKGRLQQCDAFAERNSFSVVLFMRLLPIFPFDMVNYGAGLCGVKPGGYIMATVVGIIPGTFAYVYLGSSLMEPKYIALAAVLFIVLARGPVLVRRYLAKKKGPLSGNLRVE
ncbi:MAG: TVP38/TMEM64 family protein [Deltaproteobacteria bacterium]|nr:TVP38/TMEM64 family protein [Deltaproteobacteria bacterium]